MRLPRLRIPRRAQEGEQFARSMGRLPESVATADSLPGPEPEYIAEAAPTPEDAWAREQARYRARSEERAQGDHGPSDDQR